MPNDINEMKKFVNNVKKLVEKKVNNAKTDTSKKAIVQSLNEDGTANIIINGEVYNNVKVRPGLQPQINEVVLVSIPNNNTKDMFIDLASSTSTSGGGTNHTHSNLSILETITQALIDAWNSAVSHISDTIRHITSNERDLWNTVSNKIDNTEVVTTATPNKILKLDSNGKLPASITGNATTASKLQTARTITLSGDVSGSASFDGSSNITINTTVADDSHNHVISNIDNLQTILDSKAPLASPAFTGIPTAPTAPNGTNTDQIATTKFVQNALNAGDYGDMHKSQYDTDSDGIVDRAETADKLTTARTISLSGDVVGSTIFDGSADISINTTRLIKNNSFILDSLYTFTRSSTAYLSDGTLVNMNLPRFEPGKFGKAILIEEGTTNLLGTLSPKSGAKVATEITHYTNQPVFYCDGSADWQGIMASQRVTLTAGTEYMFSVYVYNPSTDEGALNIQVDSDEVSNESIGTVVVPPGPGWHRIVRKWSPPANRHVSTIRFENRMRADWQSGSNQCYMTAPQVEAKPYATSFIDGTRAAETLTIPTAGVLNPQEGTVECWVKVPIVTNWNNFFRMDGLSNGRFLLFFNSSGSACFDYGPASSGSITPAGTIEANNWYYIALRWSATTGKQALFINGVKYEKDLPNGVATSFPSTVSVVNNYSAYIDDLRISNRARTDAEILAAYQSNEPLPYDAYTTWLSRFDNNYGLIGNSSNQIPVSNGILCTNLNADTVDGKHVDDSKTDTNSLWTASKIVNYVDPALDGKTKRINLTGQCQASSYKRSVIALVEVTNTNPNLNSNTQGIITFHRSNGLMGNVMALVNMEKRYNTTRVNYHGLTMGLNANNIRPCTFTYNGIKYGGIEFFFADAELSNIEFNGMTNFNIFGIDYYDTRGTILNSEIYNSLNFSDVNWINDIYMNNTAISKEGHTHDRINGIKISVGSIAPPSPQLNDIWIDTSS